MIRDTPSLASTEFDVLVVGGGITGAFVALDAAARGLTVGLVEKGDFGEATSAASSKLLHGGIRYLQQGQPRKVRESALERIRFQNLAPHLCRYVPFVVPAYRGWQKGRALLRCAMVAYNALCLGQNRHLRVPGRRVPRGRSISKQEIAQLLPGVLSEGITGGVLFYESHMHNSERMTLAVLETAASRGAALANYVQAQSLLSDGRRVSGVRRHRSGAAAGPSEAG